MPDTDNNTFNSLLGPRAKMADGAFSRSVPLGDHSVFKVTTDNKGKESCSCNGTDFNPYWQVEDEFRHAELRSQQDSNADPAVLTAKKQARTEVSNIAGRYLGIYHSKYGGRFMTEEQGVTDKHQEWLKDAKELVGYQEPTEDNQTAASAEDARSAAPTIADSSHD